MGYRLSKIVTKTGDDGTTQITVGHRISKDHPCIHALGDIDELNSALGIVLAYPISHSDIFSLLQQIQQDLLHLGGELCPPHHTAITEQSIVLLEENITQWNDQLPPLKEFILPGGNLLSAHCHLARTICRRAERSLVACHSIMPFSQNLLIYMNRLSDLLFILARVFAREDQNHQEILWNHQKTK